MSKGIVIVSGDLEQLAREGNFNLKDLVSNSKKIKVKYPIPLDEKQFIYNSAPGYLKYLLKRDGYIGGVRLRIEENEKEIVYSVVPVRLKE